MMARRFSLERLIPRTSRWRSFGVHSGDDRFGTVDLAWWRMDGPTSPLTITGVLLFEERLDVARLRREMLVCLEVIGRLRQRADEVHGRPRWHDDEDFAIESHVVSERLEHPGEHHLWDRIGALMSEPLDRRRPPWRLDVLERPGGTSVLVARLHHSIGDGIALMMVLLSLTALDPADARAMGLPEHENPLMLLFQGDPRGPALARKFVERCMPQAARLLLRGMGNARRSRLRMVTRAAKDLLSLLVLPAEPSSPLSGELGAAKRPAWTRPMPLHELEQLAHRLGGTLNDLLLAVVAGGLGRWLRERSDRTGMPEPKAVIPVNLRSVDHMVQLGNRFGLVFLTLPVDIDDPIDRMRELRRRMKALKGSMEPVVTFGILGLAGWGPAPLAEWIFRLFQMKTSAVITNVPGPNRPLWLAGSRIAGLVFWVPTARTGLGISIGSYAGQVRLGIASDMATIGDPAELVDAIHAELDQMISPATGDEAIREWS